MWTEIFPLSFKKIQCIKKRGHVAVRGLDESSPNSKLAALLSFLLPDPIPFSNVP